MAVISTGRYWTYRGAKIPSAYALLSTSAYGIRRETEFHTADEVVALARVIPKEGTQRYDALYFLRRKEAFRRDRYTCTVCGYRSQRQKGEIHDLECHHIDPDGGNELTNLRTVCKPCHLVLTFEAG
jgi:5-methylcytosine-specific restriction endonuclease McrA